ncbi:MAG TPA: ATP-binding protein [Polyangia bacterium]|jgi:signal transduction histidine kinase
MLRARIATERPELAVLLRRAAIDVGLPIELEIDLAGDRALDGLDGCSLVLLEQSGPASIATPRIYSLAGAHPDLLIVVVVPAGEIQPDLDAALLRAGAFDVIDDGPGLLPNLRHTAAAARRVVALQDERAQLASELAHQDKLSALGVLAAGVSHEINNPCAAILSNMSVLREQLEAVLQRPRFQRIDALERIATEWIESMGDCISAANRIHSIVKTLNVFSRKTDITPVPTDLNEDVRTVLRLIGKEVRFHAGFDVALEAGMPRVLAPPNSITQIVTNLVVNALQALESSATTAPQMTISTAFDEDHVMLEVIDNGPGMTPEVMARIFDPFFTTKSVGRGTGLGLSITRQLVQRMGGEIFVESAPGEGARFTVVLERTAALGQPTSPDLRVLPGTDRLRVLILDDDELILRSMERSLSAHFECMSLPSAQVALERLRFDHDFDVVITDVVMPEMNGIEFYGALQTSHPELAHRTLFISGGITSEALHERVTGTGRPCLAKPVDPQELVRSIRRLGRPFEELGR